MPRPKKIKNLGEKQKMLPVSEVWEEMQKVKSALVELEKVYLDPNNPRLEVFKGEPVPDDRLIEPGAQQECLELMKKIGIDDLIESIRASGFCTIDRIVLRRFDEDKYIVVEGNRRVAALKTLYREHERARIHLPKSILNGILKFEALVYEGKRKDIAWVVQGFRHAPEAIKEWEDFSKAKFFTDLEKKGREATEIARTFNVRPRREVSNLIRSYHGFQQAKEDEEYGDQLNPYDHFGFFSQVIFPSLKLRDKWLDWNESERRFRNTENLNKFLLWIVSRRITVSRETRDNLPKLLFQPEYKDILEKFEQGEWNIQDCSIEIKVRERRLLPSDISSILENLKRMKNEIIDMLPSLRIKSLGKTPEEREQKNQILTLLNEIVEASQDQIKMISSE